MLRQLLTILAVLTGLTATVAPAQALDMGTRAVVVAEQAGAVAAQNALAVTRTQSPARRPDPREPVRPRPVIVIHTPTVMLQADRARE